MTPARILIVEDETIVARDIGEQLVMLNYEAVGCCLRGEDVLEQAIKLKPDLVLMDIHLGGEMDGIEAAGLVRNQLGLPVVFLTAFAENETFQRAIESDPFGYIVKPFTQRELLTVIEIALFKHQNETKVRNASRLTETILQAAQDGFGMTDMQGRLLEINPAGERMTGYSRAELLKMKIIELSADRGEIDLGNALARIIREGPLLLERRLRRKDGAIRDLELSAQHMEVEGGRFVFFMRDITERKAQRLELEMKSAALSAVANAVMITDRAGVITWTNPAFEKLTGYSREESIGKEPKQLLRTGRHPAEFYEQMWQTILAGAVWSGEIVNHRKDGSHYTEEMTITPLRDGAGEITQFIAIKQDITARKVAEEALRESEERYRLLFDHNPLPMWLCDRETLQFIAVNTVALEKYGYTEAELKDLKVTQFYQEGEWERLLARLRDATHCPPIDDEWKHRRKDGTGFTVQIISKTLQFGGRSVRLVMAEDISEKKKLQEQFLRAQRLESLGLLASGIAHDLNNMLAPVLFTAPLLRDRVKTQRDQDILNLLERSAERGTSLVRQILSFVQGSSGEPRVTQIKHIARDVLGVLQATLPRSITLESNIATNAWPVQVNPTQIHQVLLNLGVNARDAMPQGGVLRFTMFNQVLDAAAAAAIPEAREGNWLVTEVADTGTGIEPEVMEHMWESFYTTKTEGQGSGLGLSTVRSIVQLHQGFIHVETEIGKGTMFRIHLPAGDAVTNDHHSPHPFPVTRGRSELVLVVDDDAMVRDITQAVLGDYGYRVIGCEDGIDALVTLSAKAHEVNLIITDVDMPNMNGAVLLTTVRKLRPTLPVIGMSGLAGGKTESEALKEVKEEANAFLSKPFSAQALLEAVNLVLRPRG